MPENANIKYKGLRRFYNCFDGDACVETWDE